MRILWNLAALSALATSLVAIPAPMAAAAEQPNIVLINLDDADYSLIDDPALSAYFPNIRTHLRDAGLRLDNLHVTTPLCGPSRASLLRGQYAHNTGVLTNAPTAQFTGGFGESYDNGYTSDALGRWMQDAGYTTMLVGKYLHEGFPHLSGHNRYRPPGWDEFYATRGGKYYGFTQLINGQLVGPTRSYPHDFRTDVERLQSVGLLRDHAGDADPMFLYLAPFAPHESTSTPIFAARHAGLYSNAQVPRTPDFNEADTSDKPAQIAQLPRYNQAGIDDLDDLYRRRLRSMKAVDEMVGGVVDELAALGELDNTVIMLTSDNGFSIGHNRLKAKALPYDRMTRVGMLARGPGIPAGTSSSQLLSHLDIAPTLVDIAGGQPPGWVDGHSFADLLTNPGAGLPSARTMIGIEHWAPKNHRGIVLDAQYQAVRTESAIYVEWADGGREFYELSTDPYQLDNAYEQLTAAQRAWSSALLTAQFGSCSGPACGAGAGQPPNATVHGPIDGTATRTPFTVHGRAIDDTVVARVEVIVRERRTSRYWNGQAFQSRFASIDATLVDPGSNSTRFFTRVRTGNVDLDIFVRTYDGHGTSDPVLEVIRVNKAPDVEAPTTELIRPAHQSVISGPLKVSGKAHDNFAVDQVLVVIKDQATNRFWNGSGFQSGFTRVAAVLHKPGNSHTRFLYRVPVPDGLYTVTARAFDDAGNYTDPPPIARVRVSNSGP